MTRGLVDDVHARNCEICWLTVKNDETRDGREPNEWSQKKCIASSPEEKKSFL